MNIVQKINRFLNEESEEVTFFKKCLKGNYDGAVFHKERNGYVIRNNNYIFTGPLDHPIISLIGNCKVFRGCGSLKWAPEHVTGNFELIDCDRIITLEGAPRRVNGDFVCKNCSELETLRFAPKIIEGDFTVVNCERLIRFDCSGTKVNGTLICKNCKNLSSLEGCPEYREINCINTGIEGVEDLM